MAESENVPNLWRSIAQYRLLVWLKPNDLVPRTKGSFGNILRGRCGILAIYLFEELCSPFRERLPGIEESE